MTPPIEQLPQQALDWCLRVLARVGQPCRVTRLRGGLAASTHLVEVGFDAPGGGEMVLRRFVGARSAIWPPLEQEVAALEALADCELPFRTPHVLGFDLDGSACGHPAILLTRVPGALNLSPENAVGRAAMLGRALAELHRAKPRVPEILRPFTIKETQASLDGTVIDWASVREVVGRLPSEGTALIHGDFHIGNALFEGGVLSSVVDFTCVLRGPFEFDVGYCRCDLSLLFGLAEADEFLHAYEATRGMRVEALPAWDLAGASRAHPDASAWLPGWIDAGRTELEPALIEERLARFVEQALRRARA